MTAIANNAACCLTPGAREATGAGGSNSSTGLPGLSATVRPSQGGSVVDKFEQALQAAIHGSNTVSGSGSDGLGFQGAKVIPFPVVDPYRPIRDAGYPPVAGYTAFPAPESTVQPNRNRRRVRLREVSRANGSRLSYFNARGKENAGAPAKPASQSGFVDLVNEAPNGVGLTGFGGLGDLGLVWDPSTWQEGPYSSGPSKLQTVLGTIQATLPATIAAFRASPQNIYPGSYATANPYGQQGGVPVTGGAAEGVGAGVGSAVDTLGNTVSRFVTEHPYLVIGGGAALVLLFMKPPRRR